MKHCILFTTVILLVVYSSSAFPFGENNAEGFQRFKNLLPKELVEAYSNLSPKDKNDLNTVFSNYRNHQNEQEMINDLKQINPVLGSRVERKMIELKKKVAGLSDESKRFVDSLKAAGREVYAQRLKGQQMDRFQLRQIGMGVAQHYRFLSPYAQQELQSTFPQIFEFMQQARAQMLQRFLGGGGMAGMAGMGGMDEMGK